MYRILHYILSNFELNIGVTEEPDSLFGCELIADGNLIGLDADPITHRPLDNQNDVAFMKVTGVDPKTFAKLDVLVPAVPVAGDVGIVGHPIEVDPFPQRYVVPVEPMDPEWTTSKLHSEIFFRVCFSFSLDTVRITSYNSARIWCCL